jgi:hypothetical protein
MSDWAPFVRALATELRRHANVRSLEIYNEENTAQWWDGPPSAYDSTLAAAAAAIREAAPGMQVLLGGMVWPDADWVDHACAAARVDIVPFHAYPETWTPDSVSVESYLHDFGYAAFLPIARSECGHVPVWINETGFATVPGKTERDQALWWARAIPTFLAEPAIEHIGIYELKDLAPGASAIGGAANYHLGITDTLRHPKLAFHTVRLLVRLLGADSLAVMDPALDVRVLSGSRDDLHAHAFLRPDARQVVAVWTRRGEIVVRVRLPRRGRRATEYALDGTARPIAGFAGDALPERRLTPGEVWLVEVES